MIKPDLTEVHTKYIYGIAGERVAQITRLDVSPVAFANQNRRIYASFYGYGSISGIAFNIYHKVDYFLLKRGNTRLILIALFCIFSLVILVVFFYNSIFQKDINTSFQRAHPGLAHIVPWVLILFMFQFGFSGCSTEEDPDTGDPWGTPVSIPGSTLDTGDVPGTYNDTTAVGFPVEGTFFYHPNHLGSVSMITDVDGNIVNRVYYKPYGEVIRSESSGPDIARYKYTGQEEDAETGLMYYGARYYDPEIGRFITADTMVPNPKGTQAFNRYAYVNGNPLKYRDISGLWPGEGILKDIAKDIISNITFQEDYKRGGAKGVAVKILSSGLVTYSDEGGYGATIGGNIPNTPIVVGYHWQERGSNEGSSIFVGVGVQYGYLSAGTFVMYNINKRYTSVAVTAGYGGPYANVGVGYSTTWNEQGDRIGGGWFGYGSIKLGDFIELETSDPEKSRKMTVSRYKKGDPNVVGFEDSGSGLSEGSTGLSFLEERGLHQTGVVHDALVEALNIRHPVLNLGTIYPASIPANYLVGPDYYTNPYSYRDMEIVDE